MADAFKLTNLQAAILFQLELGNDPHHGLERAGRAAATRALTHLVGKGAVAQSASCPGLAVLTPAGLAVLDSHCPRCSACGHRDVHCISSGCNYVDQDGNWCECTEFCDTKTDHGVPLTLASNAGDHP